LRDRLGLTHEVQFLGQVPRERALEVASAADVMLHPSIREGWGGAVLEGLALGLPVVCLDCGGPSQIVADGAGVRVPVEGGREQVARRLAEALEQLQSDDTRKRMGERALAVLREKYSLASLQRTVQAIYESADKRAVRRST
jgi:glycosyltransferase involved in cell wall biosynthesis